VGPLDDRLTAEIPRLRAFLGRVTGRPRVDVDDLVQESLARALRFRGSFDTARPLWPWLKRTAFRVFLDQRTREHSAPRSAPAEPDEQGAWDQDQVGQRDELRALLAQLTGTEREVLVSFHRDGRSVAEIAQTLGMPAGTVKSHLHRARRRLATGAPEEE